MKNPPNSPTYLSTSQAAKMLGLSVGTVQRMVENGVFKAFVTHGGHRRISSDSLNEYCSRQGFSPVSAEPLPEPARICVLHDNSHPSPAVDTLSQWDRVSAIAHPLDLMEIAHEVGAFFIDARLAWLHSAPLHLDNNRMQNTHIVLYNSQHLPAHSPLAQDPHISLFEGDISTDLVYGYLLCTRHARQTSAQHH